MFDRTYRFLESRRNFIAVGTLVVWLPAWAALTLMMTEDLQDILVLGLITLIGSCLLALWVWFGFARKVISDIAALREAADRNTSRSDPSHERDGIPREPPNTVLVSAHGRKETSGNPGRPA